jgi:hypothetical protein
MILVADAARVGVKQLCSAWHMSLKRQHPGGTGGGHSGHPIKVQLLTTSDVRSERARNHINHQIDCRC